LTRCFSAVAELVVYSAGVMYWSDSRLDKIEAAYLDGTGRTVLLREISVNYYAFLFHGGNIYFTDWTSEYGYFIYKFYL